MPQISENKTHLKLNQKPLNASELAEFSNQMALMLRSGISSLEALEKEGGSHLQGSIPGSEGGHWSQLQTEKPANTHTRPSPPRIRAA